MTIIEKVAIAIGAKRGDYGPYGWLGPETHAMALDEANAAIDVLEGEIRALPLIAEYNIAPVGVELLFKDIYSGKI